MTKQAKPQAKRALISVANKAGVTEFAKQLHQQGIEIISTGGTAQALRLERIPVTDVSDYTGFPEMMAGRVKTLHPKIHGGILARRGIDEATLAEFSIQPIDIVVANLYPFGEVIQQPDCTQEQAIEQIDIGGPAMIRAAAKNHASVTVVTDPNDYERVIKELIVEKNQISDATRLELAIKAFNYTSQYDRTIAHYLQKQNQTLVTDGDIEFPDILSCQFYKKMDLRYGENPHQRAAFYAEANPPLGSLATATLVQGTALSFNNIADSEAAFACIQAFTEEPACVIVKHANPCGVALGKNPLAAYQRAYQCDPTSAFGGIIAFNRELDEETARVIIDNQFVEVIIAPMISTGAQTVLQAKPKIRVMSCPLPIATLKGGLDYKRIHGGLLLQEPDHVGYLKDQLQVVTQKKPTKSEYRDLLFAWTVAKFVKSNAIVYAHEGATLGIGAGQMSRIDSARIASEKAFAANLSLTHAVMASDAFFPFADSVEIAAKLGIGAIIQPGGSIRDSEVIGCADTHHLSMVFTHIRHFRH
jgi:phosphoribosylaminoimidazolecarboxamide formyltransferase/IMP cyclohydrolase